MMKLLKQHDQAGVSLLEVLVAALVFGIGILALISLQTSLLRSSSDARDRTIATNLAQDEMEQLRSFTDPAGYASVLDTGGNMATVGTITVDNKVFTVSRRVDDVGITGGGVDDYKNLIVRVEWQDNIGNTQLVELESVIGKIDPTLTAVAAASGGPVGVTGPEIAYIPGQLPDIVPITINPDPSTTLKKEADKPLPDVDVQSGTTKTYVTEVIYQENQDVDGDGNLEAAARSRFSYLTVNCVCEFGASGQMGRKPTVYNHHDDVFDVGEMVTKSTGLTASGNNPNLPFNLSKQPEVCDICCRDHHDSVNVTDYSDDDIARYDPFRLERDYDSNNPGPDDDNYESNGDHSHYFVDINGDLIPASTGQGSLYLEACRFIRVNGIWRVTQDWNLVEQQVLPSDYLQNNVTDYVNYISELIKAYILEADITPPNKPLANSNHTQLNDRYPQIPPNVANSATLTTAEDLLPNAEDVHAHNISSVTDELEFGLTAANNTKELISRSLYIDYMPDDLINELKCMINGSGSGCGSIPTAPMGQVLARVAPYFHEINTTLLANWTEDPNTVVDVTSEAVSNQTYSRGFVTALNTGDSIGDTVTGEDASNPEDGRGVFASIENSNTGLTDTRSIDPDDDANDVNQDILDFIVTPTGPTPNGAVVYGEIDISNTAGQLAPSSVQVFATGGGTCSTQPGQGGPNPPELQYSCTFPDVSGTGSGDVVFSGYNFLVTRNCSGQGTTAVVYDNEVTNAAGGGAVVDDTETNETTAFSFSGVTGTFTAMDINISGGTRDDCANTP